MEIQRLVLTELSQFTLVEEAYALYPPTAAAFDTETDGLHIIDCRPFVFQWGWYNAESEILFAFAVDLTVVSSYIIHMWNRLVKTAPVYLAHNAKFDMHMLYNIGAMPDWANISDTQFYIRFAHDNVSVRYGGVLLGLKDYASKYVDTKAKLHDHEIQVQRSAIAKQYNIQLRAALGWKAKDVDAFFGDFTNRPEDLEPIPREKYFAWFNSLPPELQRTTYGKISSEAVPYTLVDRQLLLKYALEDIVLTLRIYILTAPIVRARGTQVGLDVENRCMRHLFNMERQGLYIDSVYVNESYARMREYILERRQDLCRLVGYQLQATQSAQLLKHLQHHGIAIRSTRADVFNQLPRLYPNHPALAIIAVVQELRTLEKWFSTYLMRFMNQTKVYTQINQVGAATLRMSSDFQQFPKKGLKTNDGQELFNPRRAIVTGTTPMVYLDYSQIELRLQALYTILVDHPDINLCRAYMPYRCTRNGVEFDYTDPRSRELWHLEGWRLIESPDQDWHPTDVHGATTKAAFNIDESHPDFSALRGLGKRVNFAKNYGAQVGKITEMFPEYPEEVVAAIDRGYYAAFPGIRHYQAYCYSIGRAQPFATNLFGVRYWGVDGHHLINTLIQGSSATLLKDAITKMGELLEAGGYETKMVLPVHDEVQFNMPESEFFLIPQLKAIMEDWEDSYVPIIADVEISHTNWASKEPL